MVGKRANAKKEKEEHQAEMERLRAQIAELEKDKGEKKGNKTEGDKVGKDGDVAT